MNYVPYSTPLIIEVPKSKSSELLQFKANRELEVLLDSRHSLEDTPAGTEVESDSEGQDYSCFALPDKPRYRARISYGKKRNRNSTYTTVGPQINRGYLLGTDENADFRLPKGASEIHCRLVFNGHCWMLFDESTNGTLVNGELAASNRMRQRRISSGRTNNFARGLALHPEKINRIQINGLNFCFNLQIRRPDEVAIGHTESLLKLDDDDELGVDTLDLDRHSSTASVTTILTGVTSTFPVYKKYLILEENPPPSTGETRRLIHKITGKPAIGKFYNRVNEEDAARERYRLLTQEAELNKHVVGYIDHDETVLGYMIVTDDLAATTLEQQLEDEEMFAPGEVESIFMLLVKALEMMRSVCIIHGDIREGTVLHSFKETRLTGFSKCRKGMPGIDTDYQVDVCDLCTLIQRLMPDSLDPEIQKLLECGLAGQSAVQLHKAVLDLTGGDVKPPFRSLSGHRTFKLRCYYKESKYFVRTEDLWQLVHNCFGLSKEEFDFRIRNDIADFYVPFTKARELFPDGSFHNLHDDEDEMKFHNRNGNIEHNYRHHFKIPYYAPSQMFNITKALTLTGLKADDLAINPAYVQEVYRNSDIEGTYIDGKSFQRIYQDAMTAYGIVLDTASFCGLQPVLNSLLNKRFMDTSYQDDIILFSGRRMIRVHRQDGSANVNQIKGGENAWIVPHIHNFAPVAQAAMICVQQGLADISKVLIRLSEKPAKCLFKYEVDKEYTYSIETEKDRS